MVFFYINREGGTRSSSLWRETERMFQLVINLQIFVRAVHIPRKMNVIADLLSCQDQNLPMEWSLNLQFTKQLFHLWGSPHVDLFAIRFNAKLPTRRPRVLPQWDLFMVLMALIRAPFEPLQIAAPKFLVWKVFFLTLLASGSRRGELHAITAKDVQHDDKWKSVSLFPHPGFILKTQLRTKGARSLQKLVIPALLSCLGPDTSED